MIGKLLPQSQYARNVVTLITGTGLAQAIPIAASPLLTRLYSPAEFGLFALYMAIASIAAVAITGRYELAILLPKSERDALHIVALAASLSFILSAVLLFLVILFNQPLSRIFGNPALGSWLYWLPASTFLTGLYQSLNYWCNRKSLYKQMSINRTLQSGGASLTQLGGGYFGVGPLWLVGGQLIGQILSAIGLAKAIWHKEWRTIQKLDIRSMALLAKKYLDFPKFLIVAHGLNTVSSQTPVMLLSALFNASTAGFYMLTQRVLGAPMSLVATAVGDVFRQEASHSYVHYGNCLEVYKKTFKRLLWISVVPFLLFFFIAPPLFALIFGGAWRVAGEYAQILTPMFFLQFITSPLSAMFMIAQKQKLDLIWQFCLLAVTSASFVVGYLLGSIKWALALFAASYSLMYMINGFMTFLFARGKK